jgi:hypothetical protein
LGFNTAKWTIHLWHFNLKKNWTRVWCRILHNGLFFRTTLQQRVVCWIIMQVEDGTVAGVVRTAGTKGGWRGAHAAPRFSKSHTKNRRQTRASWRLPLAPSYSNDVSHEHGHWFLAGKERRKFLVALTIILTSSYMNTWIQHLDKYFIESHVWISKCMY